MKKSQLYDRAEQLYVEEFWTYDRIAAELGCSDRTLRNWSKEGRWDAKRVKLKAQQDSLSDDVRDIALMLAQKIKVQLGNGEEPAQHIVNAFTRMASALIRVQNYERTAEQDAAQTLDDPAENNKTKEAAETFKRLFGTDLPL